MEIVATDVVAIGIAFVFGTAIAIAVGAFYVHIKLLERGVQHRQAELRAQRLQAAAAAVAPERPPVARLRLVPSHEYQTEGRQAGDAADESAESASPPRVAAR